jgi:replication factor C subunit 3/5
MHCFPTACPATFVEKVNHFSVQICDILQSTCKKESLNLPPELAKRIAEYSGRNVRKAILTCEACRVQQYPFTPDQTIPECDWEVFLRETASMIVEEQTPKKILDVRGRIYELLTHCIPPDIIFKGLLVELVANCDGEVKSEVTQIAAEYEHRLQLGSKAIYHIEAFVVKFMSIYKTFVEEGMADMMAM